MSGHRRRFAGLPEGMALSDVEADLRDVVEREIARLPAFRAELCETSAVP